MAHLPLPAGPAGATESGLCKASRRNLVSARLAGGHLVVVIVVVVVVVMDLSFLLLVRRNFPLGAACQD